MPSTPCACRKWRMDQRPHFCVRESLQMLLTFTTGANRLELQIVHSRANIAVACGRNGFDRAHADSSRAALTAWAGSLREINRAQRLFQIGLVHLRSRSS